MEDIWASTQVGMLATRPKLWGKGNFQALHDEAKAHVAHSSLCLPGSGSIHGTGQRAPDGARARFPLLAARARARAACLTYGPPCSFSPWCARAARRGKLGTHPEAAPGEAPNLAPSARNGRLPWELWREKVRRIRDYMLFTMHARAAHAGPTAAGLAMARYAGLSSSAAEPWGRVASTRVWPCRLSLRGRLARSHR